MYEKLMGELIQLPNLKFELGRHTDLNKLMDRAFDVLQGTEGKVRFYHKCSRCGSKNVNYSAFKGLGSDDVIHALLAKDAGCDCLIIFDKDFEDLEFRVLKWQGFRVELYQNLFLKQNESILYLKQNFFGNFSSSDCDPGLP